MDKKISFLHKLRDYKEIVDGKFSYADKQKAWEELLDYAKSIGMVSESCTKEMLRDTTWGNWKRRAKGSDFYLLIRSVNIKSCYFIF